MIKQLIEQVELFESGGISGFISYVKKMGIKKIDKKNFGKLADGYGLLDTDYLMKNWNKIKSALKKVGVKTEDVLLLAEGKYVNAFGDLTLKKKHTIALDVEEFGGTYTVKMDLGNSAVRYMDRKSVNGLIDALKLYERKVK